MTYRLSECPARVRLGIALLLFFGAATSARWIGTASPALLGSLPLDEVTASELRLADLRASVPPLAVVGYLSDPVPAGLSRAESREHFKRYVLTQYALAPALVVHGSRPELIVGHFASAGSADTATALGLTVRRELGEGLFLFARDRP